MELIMPALSVSAHTYFTLNYRNGMEIGTYVAYISHYAVDFRIVNIVVSFYSPTMCTNDRYTNIIH